MYKEKHLSRSEYVPIRGLRYHVRIWQAEASSASLPPLVLVHGWMDVAASYQFMVDALSDAFVAGRTIIAPDWRGFGLTTSGPEGPSADCYWFPDYLADLDFLLDHYASDQPVDLVGHSMGGTVSMLYAGVRPERLRRLVNLEGFGLPESQPVQAPGRYAKWIDELKTLHKGELDLKSYNDLAGVARRLMKTNPRLTPDKADWLASHWAQQGADGRWKILGEAAHKVTSAQAYRVDEALEVFARISAPMLAVVASDDSLEKWWAGKYSMADYRARLQRVPDAKFCTLPDTGHMLHHDQPDALARMIEEFLS